MPQAQLVMNSTWNGKSDTGPYQSNPLPKGMKVSRQVLRMFIFIFGTLVLVSYAYGVSHASDTAALWGRHSLVSSPIHRAFHVLGRLWFPDVLVDSSCIKGTLL